MSVRADPPCQARPPGGFSVFGCPVLWVTVVSVPPVRVREAVTCRVRGSGRVAARQVTRLGVLSVTVPVIGHLRASVARVTSAGLVARVARGSRGGGVGWCRRLGRPVAVPGVPSR